MHVLTGGVEYELVCFMHSQSSSGSSYTPSSSVDVVVVECAGVGGRARCSIVALLSQLSTLVSVTYGNEATY